MSLFGIVRASRPAPQRRWLDLDPVLLAAVFVGALVRVWSFGDVPSGMNQDEVAMAYDAFSLLHHGTDRLGIRLPTMLVSWGSGMNPLASYLDVPFIALLGLTPVAARLPFLLAGVASLPLLYGLLCSSFDRRVARIGVWLLAVCPWHIMISRWGLEANMLPFVFLAGVTLLVWSLRRPRALIAAALAFATSLYAYGPSYFVVPVFVSVSLGYGLWHRLWPRRTVALAAVAFVVAAIPMGLNLAVNSLNLSDIHTPLFTVPRMTGTARYRTMGTTGLLSAAFLRHSAQNLQDAYDIFVHQSDGLISNVVPGFGILFWFGDALALVGVALLIARAVRRRFDPSFFLLVWTGAAVALLAVVSVNVNRANILWLPYVGCAALAVEHLARRRAVGLLLAVGFATGFVGFVATYFGPYHRMSAPKFYASFGDAILHATRKTSGDICVTTAPDQPYIFVLFYTAEDPRTFYRTVRYADPHADFHDVLSFGRYRFGLDRCGATSNVLVVPRRDAPKFDPALFEAEHFERFSVLTRRR